MRYNPHKTPEQLRHWRRTRDQQQAERRWQAEKHEAAMQKWMVERAVQLADQPGGAGYLPDTVLCPDGKARKYTGDLQMRAYQLAASTLRRRPMWGVAYTAYSGRKP